MALQNNRAENDHARQSMWYLRGEAGARSAKISDSSYEGMAVKNDEAEL